MLPTYPDRLLDFATEGIIKGASVDTVALEQDTLAFARRRAGRLLEQAQRDAASLRVDAAAAGYREGLLQGAMAFQPVLQALQLQKGLLADAVAERLDRALAVMANAPDVVVDQIRAALRVHTDDAARTGTPVLYVPHQPPSLREALQAALDGVDVRSSTRQVPLLEIGAMAWELDIPAALAPDIQQALADALPAVTDTLDAVAGDYGRRILQGLQRDAERRGLLLEDKQWT